MSAALPDFAGSRTSPEDRLSYIGSLYAAEDAENDALRAQLVAAGIDCPERKQLPFEKVYFNGDMLQKYEPCMDALQTVVDAQGEDDDAWKTFEETFGKFLDFSWCSNWDGKRYDLVVYGCSGYTGYLTMEYLKRVALVRNPEEFTFAFAGRTASKVAALRDKEFGGTKWADAKIIQASYDDPVSMIDLARSARCIYNVAGPYLLTPGEMMLDACCFAGTHYVDINGEIPWMVRTLDLHERAKDCGSLICPAAAVAGGYPDLLISVCARETRHKYGEELKYAAVYWGGGGTGMATGGGTLATRNAMSSGGDAIRKIMADPFALGGFIADRDRNGIKNVAISKGTGEVSVKLRKEDNDATLSKMREDKINNMWLMPHTYAYFDTRICRKTNALLADYFNQPYGRNFNFQEFAFVPPEAAAALKAGQSSDSAMSKIANAAQGGAAAEKEKLQKEGKYYAQGEGPALEDLNDAWLGFFAFTQSDPSEHICRHSAIGTDGYFETARVACETAFTMIFDYDDLPMKGGVITCAAMSGDKTISRIINSGIKYKAGSWHGPEDSSPPPR
jgi:short subunit dehydrogenase-like uncharacterized protein